MWAFLEERDISQNELARRVRISSGCLSQLMSGRAHPSPEVRESLQPVVGGVGVAVVVAVEGDVGGDPVGERLTSDGPASSRWFVPAGSTCTGTVQRGGHVADATGRGWVRFAVVGDAALSTHPTDPCHPESEVRRPVPPLTWGFALQGQGRVPESGQFRSNPDGGQRSDLSVSDPAHTPSGSDESYRSKKRLSTWPS